MEQIRRIMRPTDVPDQGLLCDLLWSDPDKDVQGWGENDRGVSFTFGAEVVAKFLHKHDLDLICRAHQVLPPGIWLLGAGGCTFGVWIWIPSRYWVWGRRFYPLYLPLKGSICSRGCLGPYRWDSSEVFAPRGGCLTLGMLGGLSGLCG